MAVADWQREVEGVHEDAVVVGEVEKPSEDDPWTQRRLNFYGRLGFEVNSQPYTQPAYNPDLDTVPLMLLSVRLGGARHNPLRDREFVAVRDLMHTGSYGLKHPIVA